MIISADYLINDITAETINKTSELKDLCNRKILRMIILSFFGGFLVLAASAFIGVRITTSIDILLENAKTMEQGDLTQRTTVPEKNEFDEYDMQVPHLVIFSDDEPVATGRIIPYGDDTVKIGRIAVKKDKRGLHLGEKIVLELLRKSK